MGGGCGECVWVHHEQTPLYEAATFRTKAKTFRHEGFPGDSSA